MWKTNLLELPILQSQDLSSKFDYEQNYSKRFKIKKLLLKYRFIEQKINHDKNCYFLPEEKICPVEKKVLFSITKTNATKTLKNKHR